MRWRFLADVLIRTLIFLAAANLVFAWFNPMPALGSMSLYNQIIPGRTRLPNGYRPISANNIAVFNLDALFASHEIAEPKPADEFRVIMLGDSSIWGERLNNNETRIAVLNECGLTQDGMRVRFYNLGYPRQSAFKDLLLLHRAMGYDPDMVIWSVTLEALPLDKQIYTPAVKQNPAEARALLAEYDLAYAADDHRFVETTFWDRTIFGRRRDLADLLQLQVKGVGWAATGVDIFISDRYDRLDNDLADETAYHGMTGPAFQPTDLAWDVLDAGREMTEGLTLMVINEPIFLANGQNSDIRYNKLYPRWAYDQYRILMNEYTRRNGIVYLDLWDAVPADQFTDTTLHMTAEAEQGMAERIEDAVRIMLAGTPESG